MGVKRQVKKDGETDGWEEKKRNESEEERDEKTRGGEQGDEEQHREEEEQRRGGGGGILGKRGKEKVNPQSNRRRSALTLIHSLIIVHTSL